jgi:hypothetical protein
MATSLQEIRARLQAQSDRSSGNIQVGDYAIYAHWNIPENTVARVRFLPDADPKNTFFWIERAMIRLPFSGIEGQPDSKPTMVTVPCVEMWGQPCPILAEVRTWFKDKSLEEMGRKYWKKKSYLFQGFVRENPLADDKIPENPIRRFVISSQIFNLIKNALMDTELENLPTDYDAGLDFNIKKISKAGYADYNTSTWARKESALTQAERDAIEKYGLFNLADFLPKRPDDTELAIMKEMFEASVNGELYQPKWASYFKPLGYSNSTATPSAVDVDDEPTEKPVATARPAARPAAKPAAQPIQEDDDEPPFEVQPVATSAKPSSQRAEDILAMIRNRQKQ